jgi:hypothetical protein
MNVTNISKQRVEELVSFVEFEKELFMDTHFDMEEEDYSATIENFNDTIEVMKSVFEALN